MRIYPFALAFMMYMTTAVAEQEASVLAANMNNYSVYGHIEEVALIPGDIEIKARLDTGASRSSLNAQEIELIESDEQTMVSFIFDDRNGNQYPMTLPLVETIGIKQASGRQERYVVEIGLCVGEHYEKNLFTLADRSRMTYPVLVGRNFLKNSVLVSSKHKMTAKPSCEIDA
ncbi:ATP-dependent zinc protease [Methylotuvimicrobium buryatense]|nr:RimK/LysX family protein [Methylotuvimicrobium buryatense]